MDNDNPITRETKSADTDRAAKPPGVVDPRQKALALGLEFAKKCVESRSLDELYLLLTNDSRALIEFDRSLLIVHMGGQSRFVAAGNQPLLDKKSKFHSLVRDLADPLKHLTKGVLLSHKASAEDEPHHDLPLEVREALRSYMDSSGCAYLFCMPLNHNDMTVGHLVLEFLESKIPGEISILTLLNVSPFLSAALAEKWLLVKKPNLLQLIHPRSSAARSTARLTKYALLFVVGALLFVTAAFVVPVPFDVGGEAEVVATDRHVAFCRMDGLIDRVLVTEGSRVERGQVLATLEPRELDYKIKAAESQFEMLTSEMILLRSAAAEEPPKLAESNVVELKRKGVWEELQFLRWQKQFLSITSPVTGIVVTKDVESLSGKKFRAGEAFSEIVVPGELSVDVFVPEDKIAYVKRGDDLTVYLAGEPRKGYELKVQEIAPIAEAVVRLGNIYRARARFPDAPASTMVGMKGIGKIHVMDSTLWFIVSERLLTRWEHWSLYF